MSRRPDVKPVSRCQRPPAKATGISEHRPRTVGHRYIPIPHFRSRISFARTSPRHSARPRSKGSSHLHLSPQVATNPTGHCWWLELPVQRLGRCRHGGRSLRCLPRSGNVRTGPSLGRPRHPDPTAAYPVTKGNLSTYVNRVPWPPCSRWRLDDRARHGADSSHAGSTGSTSTPAAS